MAGINILIQIFTSFMSCLIIKSFLDALFIRRTIKNKTIFLWIFYFLLSLYCENNNKALKSVIKLIKDLADGKVKLTSQAIRDYFELGYINFKPTYGKKMFSLLNVG